MNSYAPKWGVRRAKAREDRDIIDSASTVLTRSRQVDTDPWLLKEDAVLRHDDSCGSVTSLPEGTNAIAHFEESFMRNGRS